MHAHARHFKYKRHTCHSVESQAFKFQFAISVRQQFNWSWSLSSVSPVSFVFILVPVKQLVFFLSRSWSPFSVSGAGNVSYLETHVGAWAKLARVSTPLLKISTGVHVLANCSGLFLANYMVLTEL